MKNSIESDLCEDLSKTRKSEMDRYGRTEIYEQITIFLQGDRQVAFSLVNHALAIVDDGIDANGNSEQLNRAMEILNQGFHGEEIKITETWEHHIYKLGQTLSKLEKDGFANGADIIGEIINYWEIEKQNIRRKGKVLPAVELDDLNLKIGKSVGLQFLYLLCPDLDQESRESIAASYGIAIKLADNLSDLHEDIEQGYINISGEDIEKYERDVESYKTEELVSIKQHYYQCDRVIDEIIKKYPHQEKGILFFKKIAHSWLTQIVDEMRCSKE